MICHILLMLNLAVMMVSGDDDIDIDDAGVIEFESQGIVADGAVRTAYSTLEVLADRPTTRSVSMKLPAWYPAYGRPRGAAKVAFQLPSSSSYSCNNPAVTFQFVPMDNDDPKKEYVRLRLDGSTLVNCHSSSQICSSFEVCLEPEPLPQQYNPIKPGESVKFGIKYGRGLDTDCTDNPRNAAIVMVQLTCDAGVVPVSYINEEEQEIMAMHMIADDGIVGSFFADWTIYAGVFLIFLVLSIFHCYGDGCLKWRGEYKPLVDSANHNVNACV